MKNKFTKTAILLALCFLAAMHKPMAQCGFNQLGTNMITTGGSNANFIYVVTTDANGNVYAGGNFFNASNNKYVAKWSAANGWVELGGLNSLAANNTIHTIITDASGNVYAGGLFKNAGGYTYVAKYTAATNTWSELGGINGLKGTTQVYALALDAVGNIYAAGNFSNAAGSRYTAKWTAATNTWSQVGGNYTTGISSVSNGVSTALAIDASGNLYNASNTVNANSKMFIAKWDGSTWSELGGNNSLAANSAPKTLAIDAAGNVYTAGFFTNGSAYNNGNWYVAKWTAATNTWSELGGTNSLSANGSIYSIIIDAVSGNLYAAGYFTNGSISGVGNKYVAKWNGTTWSELGGTNNFGTNNGAIECITKDVSGNVFAVGDFYIPGSAPRSYTAKWVNPLVPSAAIAADNNPVCAGNPVSFTASPTNGGTSPSYQWKLNNVNAGTNSPSYANSTLANNDVVTCVMTVGTAICTTTPSANGNSVTMVVDNSLALDGDAITNIYNNYNPIVYRSGCRAQMGIAPSSANMLGVNIKARTSVDASLQSYNGQYYVQRHYDIEPDASTAQGQNAAQSGTASIVLYYPNSEFQAYNTAVGSAATQLPDATISTTANTANLHIAQFHGTSTTYAPGSYTGWTGTGSNKVDITPTSTVWNASFNRWEVTIAVTGFSGFFATTNASAILPLRLLNFTGTAKSGYNQLQWQTADEKNTQKFVIEYSPDGSNYVSVGNVAAKGKGANNYSFEDNSFVQNNAAFYRLKMVDMDGEFTYSPIVQLSIVNTDSSIAIYPQPAKNYITVSSNSIINQIDIINTQGQTVLTQPSNANSQTLSIANLPAGLYLVRVAQGSGYVVKKLVKD